MSLSIVQTPTQVLTDAGGQTVSISFSSLPTLGSGIVIYYSAGLGTGGDPGVPSAADNQGAGHVYSGGTVDISDIEPSTSQRAAIISLPKVLAASGTFTVTITHGTSSNVYSLINMSEVGTAGGGIKLDKVSSGTVTTGTPVTATVTTTNNNELWTAAMTIDGSQVDQGIGTAFSGGTQAMISQNDSAHNAGAGDYKVSLAAGATASYAISNPHNAAVCVIATYFEAASAATAAAGGFLNPLW
jgi:hypothetical protein